MSAQQATSIRPATATGSVARRRSAPVPVRVPHQDGGQNWFREHVLPRLHRGAPSAEIRFDEFCDVFLQRHTGSPRTVATLRDRLAPARTVFGDWKLSELEHASSDIAAWRATVPEGSRYRLTNALRQAFAAAARWRYITRNPAVDMGANPKPGAEEIEPFTIEEVDMLAEELGARVWAAGGVRRRDGAADERVDRPGAPRRRPGIGCSDCTQFRRVTVQRRFSQGRLTPYPKTVRSRRRVPLTSRALDALDAPPRGSTPPCCSPPPGALISAWTRGGPASGIPAIKAAGIRQRGPYCLGTRSRPRRSPGGSAPFELSRLMGTSLEMIERTYGHLARDSEANIRARLEARTGRMGVRWASGESD